MRERFRSSLIHLLACFHNLEYIVYLTYCAFYGRSDLLELFRNGWFLCEPRTFGLNSRTFLRTLLCCFTFYPGLTQSTTAHLSPIQSTWSDHQCLEYSKSQGNSRTWMECFRSKFRSVYIALYRMQYICNVWTLPILTHVMRNVGKKSIFYEPHTWFKLIVRRLHLFIGRRMNGETIYACKHQIHRKQATRTATDITHFK